MSYPPPAVNYWGEKFFFHYYISFAWCSSGFQVVSKWFPSGFQVVSKWLPHGSHEALAHELDPRNIFQLYTRTSVVIGYPESCCISH